MYAFATSGNQPNNDEFSPASRDMMNNVIAARGQNEGEPGHGDLGGGGVEKIWNIFLKFVC